MRKGKEDQHEMFQKLLHNLTEACFGEYVTWQNLMPKDCKVETLSCFRTNSGVIVANALIAGM